MNLERFVSDRGEAWNELSASLDRAGGRPERLSGEEVLCLGRLYRATAADLAVARRSYPGDPVVARLEALTRRGRVAVYGRAGQGQREGLGEFLLRGYWRRVAERPVFLAVAIALLVVSSGLGFSWGLDDPGAAIGVVPDQFRGVGGGGPESGDVGIGGDESAQLSSAIFTNNIQVSFLAFAGGLLAGLGTVAVSIYNGLFLGALSGIVTGQGQGALLLELIVPHGVLELSCFAVVEAAGLRMGWALVDPGPLPRPRALVGEARRAVEVVLGTAPWLVLAGFVEGFVTGSGLGLALATAVGVALGGVYWGLVLWRGRAEPVVPAVTAGPGASL